MAVSDLNKKQARGHQTYAAVSAQWHRLCAVQPAGINGVLHYRITYHRRCETRVEIGGICEVDVLAPELIFESGFPQVQRGVNTKAV